jgi:hypothetical protein
VIVLREDREGDKRLVAFEMVKQLLAEGAEPGLLLLFDTSVPGSEEIIETKAKLSTFGKNLREQGLPYHWSKVVEKRQYWWDIAYHGARVASDSRRWRPNRPAGAGNRSTYSRQQNRSSA